MNNSPLISIIIPTHNRVSLLSATLDSVLAQTYQNWECLVIDDGSTDTTEMTVKNYTAKFPRIQYYKRPENYLPGGNGARNYGFDISKGQYINWFDSDDIMLESFLEDRVRMLGDETLFVICSYYFANKDLKKIKKKDIHLKSNLLKDYVLGNFSVLTPSVLFKKSFLLETHDRIFDPQIARGQETEFFMRVFKSVRNEDFKYINKPLFLYRLHSKSISGKFKEQYISKFYFSKMITHNRLYSIGLEIKDAEIRKVAYDQMIFTLFQSIKNKDKNVYKVFRDEFLNKTINPISIYHKIEITVLCKLMSWIGKTPKIIEKRWMNFHKP